MIAKLDKLVDDMSKKTIVTNVLFNPSNYVEREPAASRLRAIIKGANISFGPPKSG